MLYILKIGAYSITIFYLLIYILGTCFCFKHYEFITIIIYSSKQTISFAYTHTHTHTYVIYYYYLFGQEIKIIL
jgi:hypothetical protein